MPTAPNTYQPLFESFENSVGPLTESWGVDYSTFGEVRFYGNQYSTAGMKEPGADPSIGHGYGTYTITAMLTGKQPGSALILWPGDNNYPGPEINLAETAPDGTGREYATVHWSDNGVNNQNIRFLEGVQGNVFHSYQAVWAPGQITFYVDGQLEAIVNDHVPADYDHGGQNVVFAFLNNNANTSLIVRDLSYVPPGTIPPVTDPTPVSNQPDPTHNPPTTTTPTPTTTTTDWGAIGATVNAYHDATGQWLDYDSIQAMHWTPGTTTTPTSPTQGTTPPVTSDPTPPATTTPTTAAPDWGAIGATVNAYHDATGQWLDYDSIQAMHWTPGTTTTSTTPTQSTTPVTSDPTPVTTTPDAPVDWNALAAQAEANFQATGHWFI